MVTVRVAAEEAAAASAADLAAALPGSAAAVGGAAWAAAATSPQGNTDTYTEQTALLSLNTSVFAARGFTGILNGRSGKIKLPQIFSKDHKFFVQIN